MFNHAAPHPYKREIEALSLSFTNWCGASLITWWQILKGALMCRLARLLLWYLVDILDPWCLKSVTLLMKTLTVIIPSVKGPLSILANLINGGLDNFVYLSYSRFFWVAKPSHLYMIKGHSVGWPCSCLRQQKASQILRLWCVDPLRTFQRIRSVVLGLHAYMSYSPSLSEDDEYL